MDFYFEEAGRDALEAYIEKFKPTKIIVLTDTNTQRFCLPIFQKQVSFEFTNVNFKNGDVHKNIDTLTGIWKQLLSAGVDRKSLMINLGGGVVTDIGGFAAVTYKRGIDFIHVPTTLLGMVDAAIGGKNGINFESAKNQIGTIVQPAFIWIHPIFLNTLEQQEFDSGFSEMLKHGLIADADYWEALIHYSKHPDKQQLLDLIKTSVYIKNSVIRKDPTEKGLRKILNFGHTLGHAIESYLNYDKQHPLSHGYAVAIGMVLAAYLSSKQTHLPLKTAVQIKQELNRIYPVINFSKTDIEAIINLLKYDKKNENGIVKFVLLTEIGKAVYNKEVFIEDIYEAFNFYKA